MCLDYWLALGFQGGTQNAQSVRERGLQTHLVMIMLIVVGMEIEFIIMTLFRMSSSEFSAPQSAVLAPGKEVPSLIPGSKNRPADIFLPNWCGGRPAALDITVISTLQPSTLLGAAKGQGHTLQVGEEKKTAAHNKECRSVCVSFIPLVVESLGGWNDDAVVTFKRIGSSLGESTGLPPEEYTHHLFERLSVTPWRGNATQWLNHLPTHSSWVVGNI